MTRAYVALGANLGKPRQQLLEALDAIDRLPGVRLVRRSRFYRTVPWGVVNQPLFINAVAELDITLEPHALLDALQALETAAGRVRTLRYGPRTLDLDLLHIDGVTLDDTRLTLPHPRMHERAFVLLPLADLAPDFVLADGVSVAARLTALDLAGCESVA